ncbi:MAG: cation diffusion facilitator family transporter [Sphingobacteriales bacterium]
MNTVTAKYDVDQFNDIILNRRSVYPRQYEKGKVIPDEVIWQILENANRAPNHKQTEPWRFKVFSGEGRQYFAELQAYIYQEYAGEDYNEGRYQKLLEYPMLASHVISIGMRRNDKGVLPENEEIQAVSCAVENMFLTVTAYGLGSYWTTAGITYFEQAKAHFDLGEKDKLMGFFYIGYVAIPYKSLSHRSPIQTKVEWINEYKDGEGINNTPVVNTSIADDELKAHDHESQTRWVVILTIITMILEIVIGYYSNSMALTAEGWHMSTHVFAIGLTWAAYFFTRKYATSQKISFQSDRLLSLTGFTSAIVLQIIAIIMALESVGRLIHPLPIRFGEAIVVAIIGLVVNGISAILLHHDHHDHNIRAAYLHVLADGLTSMTAIIALTIGLFFHLFWLDALSGIIGSIVITSWAVQLIKGSGIKLVDFKKAA